MVIKCVCTVCRDNAHDALCVVRADCSHLGSSREQPEASVLFSILAGGERKQRRWGEREVNVLTFIALHVVTFVAHFSLVWMHGSHVGS